MKRSDIQNMPQFFDRYILKVDDIELLEGLENSLTWFDERLEQITAVQDKIYAPGKWTPKNIIQHISDNERIQATRAMRFMRNDKTVLPGYDEQLLGGNTNADNLPLEAIIEEFKELRKASITLFKNSSDEMLMRTGICYNVEISALALGFMLIGHQMHHLQVMEERYFSL
ncbi:DinB family protein [Flammeovirgaceae bacterium SG7u.111]|nr:DinB family protein [Flammeovirgaceae bacterium SG7u.132]WPO37507.1 DinB family protein [Flammeovirgaceae bacterium SG7u.111]